MASAEDYVREIVRSEEYRAALKDRLIAGKCTAGELAMASKLGLGPGSTEDPEAERRGREAMARMPRYMRRVLARLLRVATGYAPVPAAREILGAGGGLVFLSPQEWGAGAMNADQRDQRDPEPMSDEDVDLMPQAWPRT